MQPFDVNNITVEAVSLPILAQKNVELAILRLDKVHNIISGNKWYKLRYYIEDALQLQKKQVLTFGGAWSNHIVATAAVCKLNGLTAIGIIRGEEPANYSSTLLQAKELGMQLHFISRQDYANKLISSGINLHEVYSIDEGGFGIKGVAGAATILNTITKNNYTHICCAAGTGTMAAGITNALEHGQQAIAFSVLKGNNSLGQTIQSLLINPKATVDINHSYHFGGYAKKQPLLIDFMNDFYKQTGIPTDFVYTGKCFYGIMESVQNNKFPPNAKILAIHSGGLQGNRSLIKGTLIF